MSIINIFQNIINETQTIDDSNLRIKLHQVTLKKSYYVYTVCICRKSKKGLNTGILSLSKIV